MPLPSSGQLSFSQIACELTCGTPYSNLSLRNMSSTAGKTQPDAVSEFYGYSYTFSVQYLVIAGGGGGGGGYRSSVCGENSGGGCSTESTINTNINCIMSITIGGGGTGSINGCNGNNSSLSNITSIGGGGGAANLGCEKNGGSGGGGPLFPDNSQFTARGLGTASQGYNGGRGWNSNGNYFAGGGGGGAGGIGGDAIPVSNNQICGGNGGNGVTSNISGISTVRGGGGGASAYGTSLQVAGTGGIGGGGNGQLTCSGCAGSNNTGGGGGAGGYPSFNGGNGGSGLVILRYPNTVSLCIGSGLTAVCTNCSVGTNERYTCITSGTGNVCWV